ncbi:MAG: metal ABC transporter ATP-binding protein [Kiritimatiellia bacterium]|nr:ATP-binding cassette domain-containing protein [Lentisphaerota bacterium]
MMLELANLSVSLRHHRILHDINLAMEQDEFLLLLGDNGAGKTTLLRALLALAPAAAGSIMIFGRRLTRGSRRALRQRIGYVPQLLNVDETLPLTVRDVITIGRSAAAGLGRRLTTADGRIVEEAAEMVGVGALLPRPIGQLSGGERQKVQIARALCQQPDLLLLDEFSTHLSAAARDECVGLLERLYAERRLAVIMVSHNLTAPPAGCRRAVVLSGGRKVFDGAALEAVRSVIGLSGVVT